MIKALEAGASEGKGAIRFEGKMIDGAHRAHGLALYWLLMRPISKS